MGIGSLTHTAIQGQYLAQQFCHLEKVASEVALFMAFSSMKINVNPFLFVQSRWEKTE
jgi:hypothetical protein